MADLRKTEAIVVRRVPWSGSSLVVGFLTPAAGLVEAVAKGCRRPKSSLFGRIDLLHEGELVYYHRAGGALHVTSAFEPVREHVALRADVARFAVGACMAECAAALSVAEEPAPELYRLLFEGLAHLDAGGAAGPAAVVYALAALRAAGFGPTWEACAGCGAAVDGVEAWFAPEHGGVVCADCRRTEPRAEPLAPPVRQALRYCARTGFDRADRLALRAGDLRGAWAAALALLRAQTGRRIRSGAFLQRILERPAAA
ncbi:MAG: DNA repair protein RecO [Planctomycetota bacterium]